MKADFVLRGAGRLVTCSPDLGEGPLGVIEGGALAASEGIVRWVGAERDLPSSDSADAAVELDARGSCVIPGLVDCHTHLVFAGDRSEEFAARLAGKPYEAGGVRTTVEATRAASDEELARLAADRLTRFLSFGVTTIEAKSGYGLTPEHERRLLEIAAHVAGPVDVVRTFMGAHVLPPEYADDPDGYVDLVCEGMIPSIGNLAEFADVWCDQGAFSLEQCRKILRAARAEGLSLKVHAEQLSHSGGAALAAEFGAVSADHLENATEEDADALASTRTIGVLLPGASMMTGGRFAPARMLIDRGVRVAISTDFNPGTSYTENLILMLALACVEMKMTPEEAILGATRHAAAAIAREGKIGSLGLGAQCDLVVLDSESELDLVYHYGVSPALSVAKGGEVVAGTLA
ncbi:MAG TPA: imidazolonepropionase [Actinomycetota bacterium]|nr:imidazolonepropionase [Actinomycetota bacterium]